MVSPVIKCEIVWFWQRNSVWCVSGRKQEVKYERIAARIDRYPFGIAIEINKFNVTIWNQSVVGAALNRRNGWRNNSGEYASNGPGGGVSDVPGEYFRKHTLTRVASVGGGFRRVRGFGCLARQSFDPCQRVRQSL